MDEIEKRFTYHKIGPESEIAKLQAIREKALELAVLIASTVPPSREQSLSITKLEECTFWSSAAIARSAGEPLPSAPKPSRRRKKAT